MKIYIKLLLVALFALLTVSAHADPPSRVARLSFIGGEVSVQPGGIDDWMGAVLNRPLTTADRVWTDAGSRAELELGRAAVRMNGETSLGLSNVGDDIVQLALDQGTISVTVGALDQDDAFEVDTPNVAFMIVRPGEYRFNVDNDGDRTTVTVWRGEGEAVGSGQNLYVRSRQQALFFGGQSFDHAVSYAPGFDAFDEWCRVRDEREARAESARYVSPDVIGYQDLDQYGSWQTTPEYGPVWEPSVVPAGWAPYRQGHWIWMDPWGWTWVDDEPWGFAPYHYGRWVNYGGRWGWCPGPRVQRSYYAPALVAWVGGGGFSLSFGGGPHVGWFPLGYGEPYYPHYNASPRYFQRVNETNTRITNITYITNSYNETNIRNINYRNRMIPGAVTVVPQGTLQNAQPVARAAVPVPVNRIVSTPVVTGPTIPPARTSVMGNRPPAGNPPAAVRTERPVVANRTPPPRPLPWTARQGALATNGGRPLDTRAEEQIRMRLPVQPRTVVPASQPQPAPAAHAAAPAATAPPSATHPAPQPAPNMPASATHPAPGQPQAPRYGRPDTGYRPVPAPEQSRPAYVPRPPERNAVQPAPAPEPARPPVAAPAPYRPVPRPPVSTPNAAQPDRRWERPAEVPARPNVVPRPPQRDEERNMPVERPQASPQRVEPHVMPPARPAPEARPEPRPEPRFEPRPEPRPEVRPEPRPEPRMERHEPPAREVAPPARPAPPPQMREAPASRPSPPPQAHQAPPPQQRPAAPPPQRDRDNKDKDKH